MMPSTALLAPNLVVHLVYIRSLLPFFLPVPCLIHHDELFGKPVRIDLLCECLLLPDLVNFTLECLLLPAQHTDSALEPTQRIIHSFQLAQQLPVLLLFLMVLLGQLTHLFQHVFFLTVT